MENFHNRIVRAWHNLFSKPHFSISNTRYPGSVYLSNVYNSEVDIGPSIYYKMANMRLDADGDPGWFEYLIMYINLWNTRGCPEYIL